LQVAKLLFPHLQPLLRILYISGTPDARDQHSVNEAAERAHGAVDIEELHDAVFVGLVPDFMFVVVVKHDTLAFFPVQELLIDTDAAIPAVPGDKKSKMDADNTVGWPAMDRDIVARRKYRKPGIRTASRNITEL
jgi:hypothetical protein